MSRIWETIDSKIVYQNPWIKIYEDKVLGSDKKESIYSFLTKPPGIFIIALDSDKNIYLINEYRYPLKKNILQLPA